MKPNINEWTIVITGNWNVAILNPEWVCGNIFEEKEINVEVLFGAGQTGLKMSTGTVQIIPAPDRMIFSALSTSDVDNAEKAAVRLLRNLPVTPIRSIGVNFGFVEQEPGPDLLSLFDLEDKSKISDEGWKITETTLIRRLNLDDKVLNLRVSHGERGVSFHTNFHWDVTAPDAAVSIIDGKAAQLGEQAREILKKIYGLEEEDSQ